MPKQRQEQLDSLFRRNAGVERGRIGDGGFGGGVF